MNNPADTLAALAGGHLSHEEVANKVRMLMRTDLYHEAVCVVARDRIKWLASRVAELESALASLNGEAEPVAWMYEMDCGSLAAVKSKLDVPQGKAARPLIYGDTAPPPQPEPQPATGGEFCLICDMPSGEMAYCSTCASAGIAEAWVNRPGQSKTTPPAPQAVGEVDLPALLKEVRGAEFFEDGIEADLHTAGVSSIAQAFMAGRMAAFDEVEDYAREQTPPPRIAANPSPAPQGGGEAEPIGWVYQHEETGHMSFCPNDGVNTPELFQRLNSRHVLCGPAYATPPAQQPGEVGEADYKEAYSRMVAGAEKALDEIEDAGPKALKYAAQEIRAALQSADAALAPKEKGNG